MYSGKRSPDVLFDAIAKMRAAQIPAGLAARVHFYGPNSENVAGSAASHGVNLLVRQHGSVPRAVAMRAQKAAAALLIFLNMDPATSTEMGSKYLEYLGARRPMIVFGPRNSVMKTFVESHGLGWFASNAEEAQTAVELAYERFISGRWNMAVDSHGIMTAQGLSATFAGILDAVADRRSSRRSQAV